MQEIIANIFFYRKLAVLCIIIFCLFGLLTCLLTVLVLNVEVFMEETFGLTGYLVVSPTEYAGVRGPAERIE